VTLQVKRILILFSVALNIGFVVTAIYFYATHPILPHQSYRAYAQKALNSINLPGEEESAVTAAMERFRASLDVTKLAFHQARSKMLFVLAQPGPLDKKQFDAVAEEVNQLISQKHSDIRAHILDMRHRLGDEKGAQFFAAMLEQVKTSKKMP
jgi:hypothetical protein